MKISNIKLRLAGFLSLAGLTLGFPSCSFFNSFDESPTSNAIEINSISLAKTALETQIGAMEYVSVSVKPSKEQKNITLKWDYDASIIECDKSSNWGVTIKGLAEGQTSLRCSYGGYEAHCLVTVKGFAENYEVTTEPYIYSNYSVLQTSPGVSEKVFVSLYGGDVSDIDGYTWTVDNPAVASIQPTGQYCIITAKDAGYARIKITHTKAAYPYYMGVYVFADATEVSYITTSNNIVTMNQDDGDKGISVSLVNGREGSLDSQFAWEIINEKDDESPISLSCNGNNAVISPKHGGSCTLRVTHPDSAYPLDILCRVISIVKNVYIQPSTTVVTLTGETEQTITSELVNLKEGEYNIDGFKYILDDYNVAEIVGSVGNQVTLKGVANGSCKLIISHEKSEYSREVLVIANGQLKDAVDASCYITTSQNYIRTKVGAAGQTINISLKGGEDGDESGFMWSVKSNAADGSSVKVINLETANGSVFHTSARAAAATYSYGSAYLEPLAEGTAVITITHPKILYPTEILVKVLNKDAILEEPLYFSGSGLLKILNGDSQEYTVELKGRNKSESDETDISWTCDNEQITLTANGAVAEVKAPVLESGSTISHITISHPKVDAAKTVLVMTADDAETLNAMKALYSDKTYYNIEAGTTVTCNVSTAGFAEDYDFSRLAWSVKDSSIISVEKSSFNPLACKITGLKSGSTILTASIENVSCDFTVTVYPKGAQSFEPEVYFTTSKNVITLGGAGATATASITAMNLTSSEYSNIVWKSSSEDIATVTPNGTSATITAKAEGEAVISVSHKDSQNTLKIYVRVGSEYVIPPVGPVVYIAATDVMTFYKGGASQSLQAVLVNADDDTESRFKFSIDNTAVAEITAQTETGIAYIKPVASGQAEVTVTNSATTLSKKVLVIVGNSEEELAGFVYLTTASNVVSIGEGNTKSVSVSVKNAASPIVDGYTWLSSNPAVVDVKSSGATALFTGNEIGTAIITVTNTACKYSLTIIAQCVDPIAVSANPYIQLSSSVMTLNVSPNYTSISADLVGGSSDDNAGFTWTVKDSGICAVYGQNEVGKIRALAAGQTYITVSHPKAAYPAQILVVCDKIEESECYISVPSSIITMKPNASAQTITANLVNGTTTDKYNFGWSLDVYDVIDFQYSANVCTITPKQTGTVTITITHPKAAYNQQVIVNVQEYSNFAFPQSSASLTQGNVSFMNMQVPSTTLTTHVEYSVDNKDICSISGTKAVSQITGIKAGTTTVRAKLVATSTNTVQATAEMLVYVKEAPVSAVYITASSTIITLNKGKSQSLSATLSGSNITSNDQYNLKWSTKDSDIIQITGISSDGTVTGQSIYMTALKPGEALVTCSHEKATSDLQFYVVVPGTAEKSISLNKTYISLTKGSSGSTLKATIENAESNSDYNEIVWSAEKVNGNEIVRVMGSGQSVTIYPLATGTVNVTAQLPSNGSKAKCQVLVEAGKSFAFETTSKSVQPFHSMLVNYTVSPADAPLTWNIAQEKDFFEYHDMGADTNGVGYVQITGIKEGVGTLTCVTDGSAKGVLNVKIDWDYSFSVDTTKISGSPDKTYKVEYSVSPADATIEIGNSDLSDCTVTHDKDGNGKITITPHTEGSDSIIIRAKNPNNKNEEIGSYTLTQKYFYDTLTVTAVKQSDVSYADNTKTAYWSDFKNETITLGDGERLTFKLNVAESKTSGLKITAKLQSRKNSNIVLSNGAVAGQFILGHKSDQKQAAYKITAGYKPTYKGSTSYPDGTPIKLSDFVVNTNTDSDSYKDWTSPFTYDTHYDRRGWWTVNNTATSSRVYEFDSGWIHSSTRTVTKANKSAHNGDWGRVRDVSLDGKCLSVSDFQSCVWYYIPSFHVQMGGSCTSHLKHDYGEIDTDHISATYYDVTPDTSVISSSQADVLVVTITHNGKSTIKYYPIYLEVRNSACTSR